MSLPDSIKAEGFVPIKQLGQGAYGVVDKVSRRGKEVALKYSTSWTLETEIAFLAALKPHPRVVRFFESGKTGDGYYWYTMELHGGDLAYWLRRGDQRLDLKLVVRQVLEGLVHLHDLGFMHRDTHLGNFGVIWDDQKTPRIVLTDFGFVEKIFDANHECIANPRSDLSKFLGQFETAVFKPNSEMFLYELMVEAVEYKSARVLDYLLSVAYSQGMLRSILETWLPGAPLYLHLFQLNLAWKARLHDQTVAQAARTALEELAAKKLVLGDFAGESLEYLCQVAGLWDNPEAEPLFGAEHTGVLIRAVYWGKEMPVQIDRLCAFNPCVFHAGEFYTFPVSTSSARLSASRKSLVRPDGGEVRGLAGKFMRAATRKSMFLFPRAPVGQSLRDLMEKAECLDGQVSPASVAYSPAEDSVTVNLKSGVRVIEQPTVFLLNRVTELAVKIDSDS